ncbi:hypothetical protein NBRC13296_12540 [Paenibacillus chitinolyticus]|uniref:hypothetical protein n=1 Tax=Paenibacillus chitinolyticus TaxID=79263 RepID=UPI0035561B8D
MGMYNSFMKSLFLVCGGFFAICFSILFQPSVYRGIYILLTTTISIYGLVLFIVTLIRMLSMYRKNPYADYHYYELYNGKRICLYELHTPMPIGRNNHARKMVASCYRILFAALNDRHKKESIYIEVISSLINVNKIPTKLRNNIEWCSPSKKEIFSAVFFESLYSWMRLRTRKRGGIKKLRICLDKIDDSFVNDVIRYSKNFKPVNLKQITMIYVTLCTLTIFMIGFITTFSVWIYNLV